MATGAACCDQLLHAVALRERYTPTTIDESTIDADSPPIKFVAWANGVAHLYHELPAGASAEDAGIVELDGEVRDISGSPYRAQHHEGGVPNPVFGVPTLDEFYSDMGTLFDIRTNGEVVTTAYTRLKQLEAKFELHQMAAYATEEEEIRNTPHRDFYNVRKVDTHIHHSAAMNVKHILRFIKSKIKHASDDVVIVEKKKPGRRGQVRRCGAIDDEHVFAEDEEPYTLGDVFKRLGIRVFDLSIDMLQMWTDRTCMHRFDRFNAKYSPVGDADLRTVFLKTDNYFGGRYLAELTEELIDDLEESKYQFAEWRLSIYGRNMDEWGKLARWVMGETRRHKIVRVTLEVSSSGKKVTYRREAVATKPLISPQVKWMIQIPRLYNLYKKTGQVSCFQDMLSNIFTPIFKVTLDPDSDPVLAEFLSHISGFDTVDDESKSQSPVDRVFSSRKRPPQLWDLRDNPSYKYYSYYVQVNVKVLNYLRASRGLSQFHFRPHCGESGEIHHLDTGFLLTDGINHGIQLRKAPVLQYLFYLTQIGLAVSPCSNNALFLPYNKNPFHTFFMRGMNVSLSTDDPLMFHATKEPLMEEFSIAKQAWRLHAADLCEIARNSVLQSGFGVALKAHWLGTDNYTTENVICSTNVPTTRIRYRMRTLRSEWAFVKGEDLLVGDLNETEQDINDRLRASVVSLHSKMPADALPPRIGCENEEGGESDDEPSLLADVGAGDDVAFPRHRPMAEVFVAVAEPSALDLDAESSLPTGQSPAQLLLRSEKVCFEAPDLLSPMRKGSVSPPRQMLRSAPSRAGGRRTEAGKSGAPEASAQGLSVGQALALAGLAFMAGLLTSQLRK